MVGHLPSKWKCLSFKYFGVGFQTCEPVNSPKIYTHSPVLNSRPLGYEDDALVTTTANTHKEMYLWLIWYMYKYTRTKKKPQGT